MPFIYAPSKMALPKIKSMHPEVGPQFRYWRKVLQEYRRRKLTWIEKDELWLVLNKARLFHVPFCVSILSYWEGPKSDLARRFDRIFDGYHEASYEAYLEHVMCGRGGLDGADSGIRSRCRRPARN